jgi:hypothetical protein
VAVLVAVAVALAGAVMAVALIPAQSPLDAVQALA